MKHYAFITPRFGADIIGGAEALCGHLAKLLVESGNKVEIWTTTARDNRTWEHSFLAGFEEWESVIVRRFAITPRNLDVWIPLQLKMNRGEELSFSEQVEWATHGVHSLDLLTYIKAHGHTMDTLFFAPYWVTTTLYGGVIHPSRSILIPCLHDEAFAYLDIVRATCHIIGKAVFNSLPEQHLAQRLYPSLQGGEVGMPIATTPPPSQRRPPFEVKGPYLLYLGRKEEGKGVPLLVDYFISLKESHPHLSSLNLVIAGGGSFEDIKRPDALARGDIFDVSALNEHDKQAALDNALAFVQPSTMESFSIVIMEAWERGIPVIVNGLCPVTRHAVIQSSGGLFFSSQEDFSGVISFLFENADLREQLGKAGQAFVSSYYSKDAVKQRLNRVIDSLMTDEYLTHTSIS